MTGNAQNIAGDRLLAFISRIERLMAEKAALSEDLREVFSEAKDVGFDTPTIKRIVKERSLDDGERAERAEIYQMYAHAIGMTPMEEYIQEHKPVLAVVR